MDEFYSASGGLPLCLLEAFRKDVGIVVHGEPRALLTNFAIQLANELQDSSGSAFEVLVVNPLLRRVTVGELSEMVNQAYGFLPAGDDPLQVGITEDHIYHEFPRLQQLLRYVRGVSSDSPWGIMAEFEHAFMVARKNQSKGVRTLLIFDSIDLMADLYGLAADSVGPPAARLMLAVQEDLVNQNRGSAVYVLERPLEKRFESLCDGKVVRFSVYDHKGRTRNLMSIDGVSGSGNRRFFPFLVDAAGRIHASDFERVRRRLFKEFGLLADKTCDECHTPLEWDPEATAWRCPGCGPKRRRFDFDPLS